MAAKWVSLTRTRSTSTSTILNRSNRRWCHHLLSRWKSEISTGSKTNLMIAAGETESQVAKRKEGMRGKNRRARPREATEAREMSRAVIIRSEDGTRASTTETKQGLRGWDLAASMEGMTRLAIESTTTVMSDHPPQRCQPSPASNLAQTSGGTSHKVAITPGKITGWWISLTSTHPRSWTMA